MNSLSRILISIIGVLVIGFIGILLYIYWPAITGTVNGSKYYTSQDVQDAYDKGYDDALKNESELTEQVNYYKELTDSYYSTILEYQSQIEEYETLNQTNKSTISSLEQNKKDLESQVESLTLNKTDNEETIKNLNVQIETLQNQVESLESSGLGKDEQIVQLNSQIVNLQEMVLQLQTTNDINTSTIKTLNSQITSLNKRIIELSNQVVSNDNSLSSLKSKIQELENSISYYENYIANLESEQQIVVTFEFAGSVYNIQVIDKNSSLSVVNPTSTEFVIFNYWTVDGLQIDLSNYIFTQNTKVVADVTYKYQVKFLVDGETYSDVQIVEEGEFLSLPEPPTKDKHKFVGWSLDGKEVISNIETLPVSEDLTYIAIFETSIYVTFMNGTEIYDSIEVVEGKITSLPEDPQKEQYFFNGWKLDSGEIVDLNEYHIEDSLIVYADYAYNWDGTYEGRSSGTYYLTVNVKNQEIVSVSYMGKTQEVKKLENGKYRTVSGISATSGSYTYIHFTMEFTSMDGRIYVTYKWNKSSNYDYQGASTSSTFYANRVE